MSTTKKTSSNKSPQLEKLKHAARGFESDDRGEAFDENLKRVLRPPRDAKVCPECGHEFRGNGWDGIDAHWKSKHDHVMPYAEAWPLIQSGKYLD